MDSNLYYGLDDISIKRDIHLNLFSSEGRIQISILRQMNLNLYLVRQFYQVEDELKSLSSET